MPDQDYPAVDAAVEDGRLIQKRSNYYLPDEGGEAGEHVGQGKAAAAEWLAAQAGDTPSGDDPSGDDTPSDDTPPDEASAPAGDTLTGRYRYVGATTDEVEGARLVTGTVYAGADLQADHPVVRAALAAGLLQQLSD